MVGIVSYGAYIPLYRMSRAMTAAVWGGGGGGGERAIANSDEDSITMAVEAAKSALAAGTNVEEIDALYFASTTSPYKEKQSASIIAAACDLKREADTIDISNSIKGATSALKLAIQGVSSKIVKRVVVTAADTRLPPPNTEAEMGYGDAAAAVVIGDTDVALTIDGNFSISSEFVDFWRTDEDIYPRTWEDRFVYQCGYTDHVVEVVKSLYKKYGVTAKDFTKFIIGAPNSRQHGEVARALGLDVKKQVQESFLDNIGFSGNAAVMMMLAGAIEEAKPGDKFLMVNYGDGADAFILTATEKINDIKSKNGVKGHLSSKMMLPNYGKYLRYRDLMKWEPERRPPDLSSLNLLWRERRQILRFHAHKCRQCGTVQYPMQRVCTECQAKDNFDEVRLADKRGKLFTFSMDERAMEIDLPNIICIIDLDIGGRFFSQMTDRDPGKVEIGMPVEMTFRKIHEGSGVHNYFWKCRPVRC